MHKQLIAGLLIGLIVGGAGSYVVATKFMRQSSRSGNFANLSPEERQARSQQFGGTQGSSRAGMGRFGGAAQGEIIAKDDTSITVKLQDGGSRIVYLSASTTVARSTEGNLSDLTVGENVIVFGSAGSDGTVTAQSVQIRPSVPVNADR
jgi:hypothetical protein